MRGLTVGEVMIETPDFVRAEMSLPALADTFVQTHHHGFPVLNKEDHLLGIVTIQDLERATAQNSNLDLTVADITQRNTMVVQPDDPLSKALRLMSEREFGRMPVVDPQDHTRLVGLLRRKTIIRAYRHAILRKLENQHKDESLRLKHLTDTEMLEFSLASGMAAVGKHIKSLRLPPQTLIASVRRDDQIIIAHGETLFQPGDRVIVITQRGKGEAVRQVLAGEA